ncbi:hypothetical protein CAI21_13380 [Alkalilimnicola ehrlichii]|uniref:L,D-TPase catalytic domain-containing protein n=1 Tax=Alkalilimnicola ehrlichii TaxID=351052 RepID=A0A3E0WI64_9GAMM|nr:L,D-transpeptidase [Alkalilimnicola ehrlichii]RFA28301.1 hypothetical protein CAI21_13380 [Alkalilimnicola ehrlichii]RFA31656.1 hypothetical protein CAL65_21955 [Alkalilimnicola ehrlichii]
MTPPTLRLLCLLLSFALIGMAPMSVMAERWVLIDTQQRQAKVYDGEQELARFAPVAVGMRGTAHARLLGDRTTPLGEFRVDRINSTSRFHIFLGINYPTLGHARDALDKGLISFDDYLDFREHLHRTGYPPQDTVLGGNIGIHGIGRGDPSIHELFDWTRGCVAVTNEQIERLAELVGIGTRVVIR